MNTGHRLLPTLKNPGKHDIESSGAEFHFTMSLGLPCDVQEPATSLLHISVIQLTEKRLSKVVNIAGTPDPSSSPWVSLLLLSLTTQDSTPRASLGTSNLGRAGQNHSILLKNNS